MGSLILKYRPVVGAEIKDILRFTNTCSSTYDLGDWFEWSFNHILKEKFHTDVRQHYSNTAYENIFRGIEPDYVRSFIYCLDNNANILDRIPENLTIKAVLTHETLVIVASPKINF